MFQRRNQNAGKVTHTKGRLLDQAMVLFNCVPYQMGNSLKGKNLLPVLKSLLPHRVTSLECYYFITNVRNSVMGATPMCFIHQDSFVNI